MLEKQEREKECKCVCACVYVDRTCSTQDTLGHYFLFLHASADNGIDEIGTCPKHARLDLGHGNIRDLTTYGTGGGRGIPIGGRFGGTTTHGEEQ